MITRVVLTRPAGVQTSYMSLAFAPLDTPLLVHRRTQLDPIAKREPHAALGKSPGRLRFKATELMVEVDSSAKLVAGRGCSRALCLPLEQQLRVRCSFNRGLRSQHSNINWHNRPLRCYLVSNCDTQRKLFVWLCSLRIRYSSSVYFPICFWPSNYPHHFRQSEQPDNNPVDGLSNGAKAGIGIGVGLACISINIGVLWYFLRYRRQRQDQRGGRGEVRTVRFASPEESFQSRNSIHNHLEIRRTW